MRKTIAQTVPAAAVSCALVFMTCIGVGLSTLHAQDAGTSASTLGGAFGSGAAAESTYGSTQPPVTATNSVGPAEPNLAPAGGDRFQGKRFRTTVSVRTGYDTNVYTAPDDAEIEESLFSGVSGAFTYNFGNQRTQLSLGATAGADYYFDVSDDELFYNFGLNLGVTHLLTPRLTVGFSTNTTYQSQPDFSIAFASTRQSGEYFYSSNRVFGTYLWTPKLQTVTGYTLGFILYDESGIASTGDRMEHNFSQEFRFLWTPTTTVIGEYRYGFSSFDENSANDNQSHFALVGLDHRFSPSSSMTSRVGAQFTTFDADEAEDVTVPYAEFSFNYQAGDRTLLSWYNRLGLEQSELRTANERYTYRTGLAVRQGFTARLNGKLGAYYSHDEYSGTGEDFSDDSIDISTSLEYLFSRLFSVAVGYQYSSVFGSTDDRGYDRNKFYLSLNASF